jgi:hypothetical protein
MDIKASNIETIDYGLMITNYKFMNIHIDIKASDITYYRVMNTQHTTNYRFMNIDTNMDIRHKNIKHKHNKLQIHERQNKLN